ncbi:MaoC/PaaZ C-terminal domain-containing protein [Chloroflexota bacterium]
MAKQVYYEDVEAGSELPTLIKHPTPRQLVMWAGVSGDFYEIHYDKDFALSQGLPDIIVQGDLTGSFLAQLVIDWMGEWGTLKKLRTSNRGTLFPNEDVICQGKVSKKYIEKNEHYVECEIWAENNQGEKRTLGMASVTLPTRGKDATS